MRCGQGSERPLQHGCCPARKVADVTAEHVHRDRGRVVRVAGLGHQHGVQLPAVGDTAEGLLHGGGVMRRAGHGDLGTAGQPDSLNGLDVPARLRVTLMSRKLEASGHIRRRPAPSDKRASIVELTDSGATLAGQVKQIWRALAEETVTGLAARTVARLPGILTTLTDNVDIRPPPPARPESSRSRGPRHARTCRYGALPADERVIDCGRVWWCSFRTVAEREQILSRVGVDVSADCYRRRSEGSADAAQRAAMAACGSWC